MPHARAFSYLRVSGKGQIDGDGFPRQRETVTRYAQAHGINLVREFQDGGVCGDKELSDRDGLAALLDAIESDGVRVVLIERADRLARDLMVSEVILGQFRDLGVEIIAADSGTELTAGDGDPTRILIRQVLAAVAQFEKNVIVLKLRAARERKKRQNGRCEGRKPFGSRPGEQVVLKRMRALHRKPPGGDRLGPYAIATILNREQWPSRTGKPWSGPVVARMLARRRPQGLPSQST